MARWPLAILGVLVLTLMSLAYCVDTARGQAVCASHEDWRGRLMAVAGEHWAGLGVTDRGQLAELFVNPSTGSWTVIMVRARDKCARPILSGHGWESLTKGERGT